MTFLKKFKYWILGGALALGSGGIYLRAIVTPPTPIDLNSYAEIGWIKPTKDIDWEEDVKAEQLNMRLDYQLEEMRINLSEKLVKHEADLLELRDCSQCYKYPLQKKGIAQADIDAQYDNDLNNKQLDYELIKRSLERVENEIRLRADKTVDRKEDIIKIQPSTEKEKEEIEKLKNEKIDI